MAVVLALASGVAFARQTLVIDYLLPIAEYRADDEAHNWANPAKFDVSCNADGLKFQKVIAGEPERGCNYRYKIGEIWYTAFANWVYVANCTTRADYPEFASTYSRSAGVTNAPGARFLYEFVEPVLGKQPAKIDVEALFGTRAYNEIALAKSRPMTNCELAYAAMKGKFDTSSVSASYVQLVHTDEVYTVSYDCGKEASGTMAPQTVTNSAPVKACTVTRTGYNFSGWTSQQGGSAVEYLPDAVIEPEDDLTLYAVWTSNRYTVEYMKGAEDAKGEMEPSEFDCGVYVRLASNAFTRAGYDFDGWAETEGAVERKWKDGDEVIDLAGGAGLTKRIYAFWTPHEYLVTYVPGAGASITVGKGNKKVKYLSDYGELLGQADVTRPGYTFVGWYSQPNGGVQIVSTTQMTTKGNVRLYARWQANTYDIRFWVDDVVVKSQEGLVYDVVYSLSPYTPIEAGRKFIGWATDSKETRVAYANGAEVKNLTTEPNGEVNLYALFGASLSYVRFEAATNGVTGVMPLQNVSCGVAAPLKANAYVRPGYAFAGWSATQGGAVAYVDGDEYMAEAAYANKTNVLYAVWTNRQFRATFDLNGAEGTVTPESRLYAYGQRYGEFAEVSVAPDYYLALTGWSTEKEGGEILSTNALFLATADTTLYAQMHRTPFPLAFNAMGGTLPNGQMLMTNTTDYIEGEAYGALPLPTPQPYAEQSVFAGWWTSPMMTNGVQQTTNMCASLEVRTLYARWKKPTAEMVTVTFDNNTKDIPNTNIVYKAGAPFGTLPVPVREGYRFYGWFTQDATPLEVTPEMCAYADATFKARWTDEAVEGVLGFDGLFFENVSGTWSQETSATAGKKCPRAPENTLKGQGDGAILKATAPCAGTLTFEWAKFSSSGRLEFALPDTGAATATLTTMGSWKTIEAVEVQAFESMMWKNANGAAYGNLANFTWTPAAVVSPIAAWTQDVARASAEITFETSGTYPWQAADEDGIRSGTIDDSNYSAVRATVPGCGIMTFNWRTACEPGFVETNGVRRYADRLELLEGGTNLVCVFEGAAAGTAAVTNLSGSAETYTWRYVKDSGGFLWEDCAWLDNVKWRSVETFHTVRFCEGAKVLGEVQVAAGDCVAPLGLSRNGYAVEGWYEGGSRFDFATPVTKSLTLNAHWQANSYVVTLDKDGTGSETTTQNFVYDQPQALKACPFARAGYDFAAWVEAETGARHAAGEVVSNLTTVADGNVTLVAAWKARTFAVRFEKGGSEVAGEMLDEPFTYDQPQTLTANAFTRSGYDFKCWQGSAATYADGALVSNLTTEAAGIVPLTALWMAHKCTVKIGGESASYDYGEVVTAETNALEMIGEGLTNRVCTGWAGSGDVPSFGSANSVTFTVHDGGVLNWFFQTNFWVVVETNAGGQVTWEGAGTNALWASAGTNLTAIATPDEGWKFLRWEDLRDEETLEGDATSSSVTLTIDRARVLRGVFADMRVKRVITIDGVPQEYVQGQVVTSRTAAVEILASGLTNRVCTGWTGTGDVPSAGTTNSVGFTVRKGGTLEWRYATNFWVSVSAGEGGEAVFEDRGTNACWAALGGEVTAVATPSNGWTFAGWYDVESGALITLRKCATFTVSNALARAALFTAPEEGIDAYVGQYFERNLSAYGIGGSDVVRVTITGIPAGLKLKRIAVGNWCIEGVPTAVVEAKDAQAAYATVTYKDKTSVMVAVPLVVAPTPIWEIVPPGVVGEDYGSPCIEDLWPELAGKTWKYAGWPTGLKADKLGKLVGKPKRAGIFTVTATRVCVSTLTKAKYTEKRQASFVVGATAGMHVDYTNVVGEAVCVDLEEKYPNVIRATGLPTGLKLTGGIVSGVPRKAGAYTVTLTVAQGNLRVQKLCHWRIELGTGASVSFDFGEATVSNGMVKAEVGLGVEWLVIPEVSDEKVTVSGLPTGLKYKAGVISGIPRKAGNFVMRIRTVYGGVAAMRYFAVQVAALPTFLIGNYAGAACGSAGWAEQGTLRVTADGRLSGKFYLEGKAFGFSALSFSQHTSDVYVAEIAYRRDRVQYTSEIALWTTNSVCADGGGTIPLWQASLAREDVTLAGLELRRNVIKEYMKRIPADRVGKYPVYRDLETGAWLDARVVSSGVVSVSGKLPDATGKLMAVSCATQLAVLDDARMGCWITIYKSVRNQTPIVYEQFWELPQP